MKIIKNREQALDVLKSAERFGIEQDMWSVVIFHKDMMNKDICCEVSYFDAAFRKNQFVEKVQTNFGALFAIKEIPYSIYVGTECQISKGLLFEED